MPKKNFEIYILAKLDRDYIHCTYSKHRCPIFITGNDKKENQIFLIYNEIQNGAVAMSYIINGLLIFAYFLIYEEALHHI
jgi:hypothetical protein